MKRILFIALAGVLVAAPVATAGTTSAGGQKESGTVLFPMPDPQDGGVTCFQGTERRINMVTQGAVTGAFGYIFDVDKSTWNGKFKLELTGGMSGEEDLDIYFYTSFGPPITEDPTMNSPSIIAEFTEAKPGGEKGVVPEEATKATVCMKGGFAASFDYVAKAKKK